jgi:hypothetical protein
MKIVSLFTLAFVLSTPAFAAELRCTLQSGSAKKTASLDLDSLKNGEGNFTSDVVGDLSISADLTCKKDKCDVNGTVDSTKAEDEVGEFNFSFNKGDNGRVYGDGLTGAPDHKKYALYCYVD